jgi:heme A synthase
MPKAFTRYAAAVLAYNLLVVLWGAYVRATGSGAGCGNHWPLCNGQVFPQSAFAATLIEFTHRASSGIDLVLVAALVVWAFRGFPRGHLVRLGATLSAVFLATEALIGAALVKLEHVAHNASVGRAYSLSTHSINTLTLLACLALTVWWARGGGRLRFRGRAAWLAIPAVALVVLAGISGAIAALGDTLFPATSLAAGFQQDFDPAASIFLRLRLFHPLLAVAAAGWLVFSAATLARRPSSKRYAWAVLVLVGGQVAAGGLNLFLLAPVWLQMVHLLLADLVWISLVLLLASALQDSAETADTLVDAMANGIARHIPPGIPPLRAGSK